MHEFLRKVERIVRRSEMHRLRSALGFALVLMVIGIAAAIWWPHGDDAQHPASPRASRADTTPPPRSRPEPRRTRARTAAIGRLEIPAIGVHADVITLGLNADHTLQVPASTQQTGWWKGGAYPGRPGAAVIVGHVDSTRGPAVFFRLSRLRRGDVVTFRARGGAPAARFVVSATQRAPKDSFPTRRVYRATPGPTLRLVTCTGVFDHSSGHYESNLIVYARGSDSPVSSTLSSHSRLRADSS